MLASLEAEAAAVGARLQACERAEHAVSRSEPQRYIELRLSSDLCLTHSPLHTHACPLVCSPPDAQRQEARSPAFARTGATGREQTRQRDGASNRTARGYGGRGGVGGDGGDVRGP